MIVVDSNNNHIRRFKRFFLALTHSIWYVRYVRYSDGSFQKTNMWRGGQSVWNSSYRFFCRVGAASWEEVGGSADASSALLQCLIPFSPISLEQSRNKQKNEFSAKAKWKVKNLRVSLSRNADMPSLASTPHPPQGWVACLSFNQYGGCTLEVFSLPLPLYPNTCVPSFAIEWLL